MSDISKKLTEITENMPKVYAAGYSQGKTEGGNITVDSQLSLDSTNPVQNKVITERIIELENDKQDKLTIDETPTQNSENPISSGGVYDMFENIGIPKITTNDAGKFLRVSSEGKWIVETILNAEEVTF